MLYRSKEFRVPNTSSFNLPIVRFIELGLINPLRNIVCSRVSARLCVSPVRYSAICNATKVYGGEGGQDGRTLLSNVTYRRWKRHTVAIMHRCVEARA